MIKEISANARISFKQATQSGDVFYTFEYGETRTVDESIDIQSNRNFLWDDVNNEINNQIKQVKDMYNKNR